MGLGVGCVRLMPLAFIGQGGGREEGGGGGESNPPGRSPTYRLTPGVCRPWPALGEIGFLK